MPKTRLQNLFFTALTAFLMVYGMTLYHTVLSSHTFTNGTFLVAWKSMWMEFALIFLLAYFVSGRIAKWLAFRVVQPDDRPIFIIFAIQIFTVVVQVAFASILGVYHAHGFSGLFLPHYIESYCENFQMALPLQLFLVGPLARFLFRRVVRG